MSTGVFRVEQVGPTMVVTPTDDLRELEFDRIEDGAAEVFQALEKGHAKNVVIDLHHTSYYGSTALSFFVKLWKRVKTDGGQMVLCGVSDQEQEVLQATHLDKLWPQSPDRARALTRIDAAATSAE